MRYDRSLLLTLSLSWMCTVRSATYHVAFDGDDANAGTSPAQAFATLQHAADMALAGDSVVVHPGTYMGFAAMDHIGTSTAPIVFRAMAGATIDVPCSYNDLDGINVENTAWIVVEGFRVEGMPRAGIRTALSDHVTIRHNVCADNYRWGIFTGFAEHVTIEHNECSGSEDEHGIYHSNSADDPIIRFNHLHHNNGCGIHMNGDASMGGDGTISGAQVYANIIHDNGAGGGSAINGDGLIDASIYNNVVYGNHASGISLYMIDAGAPSTGNRVYNNTVVNPSDARWCINITDGSTGNTLINNILVNQHAWRGSISISANSLGGFISHHNLLKNALSLDGGSTAITLAQWQSAGYDANSMIASAPAQLFADANGGDFSAASNTAQQVDAGSAAVGPIVQVDLLGILRPQGSAYDIGAQEHELSTGIASGMEEPWTIRYAEGSLLFSGTDPNDRIAVYDATGRCVLQHALSGGQRIPFSGPCGLYLVERSGTEVRRRSVLRVVVP